jgi:hypothetical protein
LPNITITPLEGITAKANKLGIQVLYQEAISAVIGDGPDIDGAVNIALQG